MTPSSHLAFYIDASRRLCPGHPPRAKLTHHFTSPPLFHDGIIWCCVLLCVFGTMPFSLTKRSSNSQVGIWPPKVYSPGVGPCFDRVIAPAAKSPPAPRPGLGLATSFLFSYLPVILLVGICQSFLDLIRSLTDLT